jgi:hypothetical protein
MDFPDTASTAYTPFGALLHRVPPYSLFHYAERHFESTQLAVSLLAADGLDQRPLFRLVGPCRSTAPTLTAGVCSSGPAKSPAMVPPAL